jgi:MGT family glycosyltransferase
MQSKKILFACIPADGHFNPLTGLAMHLKDSGHDVRWYTQSLYQTKIERMGITHYPFKRPPQLNQLNFEGYFEERKNKKSQISKLKFDIENVFVRRVPEFFEDIEEIYQSFAFDLFIADIMFTAIPVVREKLRVPVIAIGIQPIMETSRDLPPAGLGRLPSYTTAGKLKQAFMRKATSVIVFNNATKLYKEILCRYKIPVPAGNVFDIVYRTASIVLQIGVPGFEYPRKNMNKNIRFVGTLLPGKTGILNGYRFSHHCKKFKKKILVTQGTVEKDIEKILVPTLDAFKNTEVLVIVATGGSQTEALKKRYPNENFIIEDFIPFNDIMDECDVFVTNGGYGGVMLAVSNELPIVAAGVHEGKNEINARIEYFKLGINLRTEKPSAAQIRKSVETVLKNSDYKNNVIKLAKELRQYNSLHLCEKYIGVVLRQRLEAEANKNIMPDDVACAE